MGIDVHDAALGSLVGLAVGDALGAPVEFLRPGTFEPVVEYRSGGVMNLPEGCWTDDTALALCLAESLIACGGMDPADQLQRYVRYWREGYQAPTGVCLDIGTTTRRALEVFLRTGATVAGPAAGLTPGNGSLMRLAPVPIFWAMNPLQAVEAAAEMSRTTHAAPESVDACRYVTALLVSAIHGARREDLVVPHFSPAPGFWDAEPLCPAIEQVVAGSFLTREPPEVRAGGGAVDCLEAALWAFSRGTSFEEVVLAAVNLGEDADTAGAVAGQLAGACYGHQGIPLAWRTGLHRHQDLVSTGMRLVVAGTRAALGLEPSHPVAMNPVRRRGRW